MSNKLINFEVNKPLISIIIPVKNNSFRLEQCLSSVFKTYYGQYECIVIDDASTDDSISISEKFPVNLIKCTETKGPAVARNIGTKNAEGDILFFIDSDVVIYPDTLYKVVDAFKKNTDVDAIIGSYDDEPYDTSFLSQYKNLFHHYIHQNTNKNICTFWSGCGAIRREVFLEHDGYNESYSRPSMVPNFTKI